MKPDYSSEARHLLLFEPDHLGHVPEWIRHLLAYVERRGSGQRVSLAVCPRIAAALRRDGWPRGHARIDVMPLAGWETALCKSRFLPLSGMARWWVMRRYLRRSGADHGLFLELDHLTLPLALGLRFAGRQVSGILFRPSVHYPPDPDARYGLRSKVRDLRKTVLYQLSLYNPALRAMRTLDPYFPEYAARHYRRGEKVVAVPDPVNPVASPAGVEPPSEIRPPPDRVLFAIFGVLSERKGVLNVIEALRRLESRYASVTAIYAAGQVEPRIARRLHRAFDELIDQRPEAWFHVENRRLTDRELAGLVERADVVLAPYQHFVGSSGVLLWAAKAGKPVLTQNHGLLGRYVREYRLGVAVDCSDPSDLAAAMAAFVRGGANGMADREGMARFVAARTPEAFAAGVLDGIFEFPHWDSRHPARNEAAQGTTDRSQDLPVRGCQISSDISVDHAVQVEGNHRD